MKRIQSIPDAQRVTEGLRHSGYTPETAIADLVDNSIAAGAENIMIRLSRQVDQSYLVWIGDDGCGMSEETLIRAMQYGSDKDLARSGLSVYGLGMKMASTTFTKKFSVVTREKGRDAVTATYDLNEMAEHPWSFTVDKSSSVYISALDAVTGGGSGTVVIWENADFQTREQSPRKKKATGPRKNLIEDISMYLGMVFHRFMDGTIDGKRMNIRINDSTIDPWNPVNSDFLHTDWTPLVQDFYVDLERNGSSEKVPYTLTTYRLNGLDDPENVPGAWSASRVGMQTQGIYAYRENRILQNPSWLNVLVFHPDTNTLRATLELDPRLDEIIRTDVKKSGLMLSDEMWESLKESLEGSKSHLKQAIKQRKDLKKKKVDTSDIHKSSNKFISNAASDIPTAGIRRISPTTIEIETPFGSSRTDITDVSEPIEKGIRIKVVESLDNGFLWEPRMQGADQIIFLNKSHPFYLKVYIELRNNPLAIQGLDFLLYALANAELQTRTDRVKEQFTQMRQLMSNNLRSLVLDLEEVEEFTNYED